VKVLALETSSEWCSCALWLDASVLADDRHAGQAHSEIILPMIDALLRETGVDLTALDGVAFGAGPGSFTGMRIACGVAQGLAFGAGLPVVPVGTLQALAQASGATRCVGAIDARMGEIYHAAYERRGADWEAVHEPSLCRPEAAPLVEGGDWVGAGSGFAAHGEILRARYGEALRDVQPERYPHARDIAALGARALVLGRGLDPAEAVPIYIRDKVALSVAEREARKAPSATGMPQP
jgi:tRNA threonylcarbamoyladenosine biosynthesis protein TsaB